MPGIGVLVSVVLLATARSTQSIPLKPEILLPSSTAGEGAPICLSPAVEGIPDPVGRRTTTLLHLPAGKVVLDRGPESIVHGLRKALEATGYRVTSLQQIPGGSDERFRESGVPRDLLQSRLVRGCRCAMTPHG